MPGRRGARVAMEQQHRRTRSAPPPEQLQSTAVDHALRESLEHADSLPDPPLESPNHQAAHPATHHAATSTPEELVARVVEGRCAG